MVAIARNTTLAAASWTRGVHLAEKKKRREKEEEEEEEEEQEEEEEGEVHYFRHGGTREKAWVFVE